MRPGICIGLWLAMFTATSLPAAEVTENLVADGGMEQWRTTGPDDSWWNYLTVQWQETEFTRDDRGRILTPKIADQLYDTKILKPEANDVYSGQSALRLKGQLYLRAADTTAYNTRDGDIYLVRYQVKGTGQSSVHLHVYGEGIAQLVESKGVPEPDRWTLIEQRIQIVGPAPTTIFPRLWASEEVLIDDLSIVRVIRPGERPLQEVPAALQERIAFASPAAGAITPDGLLDEPSWAAAVAFSGFRPHADQQLLAPAQPSFRVLYDDQALYFGVEIPLPNARQVLDELAHQPLADAQGQPRPKTDTYTSRHSVEFFLQAPGQSGYRQLVISLDGYRYDGSGMDRTWDGDWDCGIHAAEDRWFLELRVPVTDLGVLQTAPAEGWRLNMCINQPGGGLTWAAVGGNYHNPDAFGRLIAQDFTTWRNELPERLRQRREEIARAAGAEASLYAERLATLEAALSPGTPDTPPANWQAVTRAYAQLDFVAEAYRRLAEEVRYRSFFQ